MNRFDNISVSAYTPQSFEELAFVPMMKRKQHDDILAKQELVRAGLAKVDPYDKHFDEAIKLKQDMESQLDNTATELSKSGINNDMIGKTIALNRQYQDLISPTGKLGQINAEKINIQKINDEYDKYGQQKGWSETETNYWKQKALEEYNKKPIYDDKGKILNYSGPKEIANKIDYNERLHKLASAAGMTTEEFKQGMSIAVGQDASGYFTQGHQMEGWSKASNNPQVAAAYNTLIQELNDPTSELRKSAEYERRDLNSLVGILGTQKDIYLKNQKSNESDYTIDHFGSGPDKTGTKGNSDIYGEDYNTQEVGGSNQNFSEIERIGKGEGNTAIGSSPSVAGSGTGGYSYGKDYKGKVFSSNDIKDPKQKALYNNTWKKATTDGVMIDGKKVKLTKESIALGKDNPKVMQTLLKAMKQSPAITLTSKLLTKDIELDNSAFSSSIGKTADERDKQIQKQLKLSNSGARKLLDPETGKVISFAEAQEKYDLEDVNTVTYHGYLSPLNWEEHSFNGTNSKASPHVITVKTKDGGYKEFKTSRLNSDNVGINVNRYNDLNKNYRNWSINHDEFIDFESDSPSLKGLKVKYNTQNPKIDQNGRILDIEVLDKNGTPHYMTQAEFTNSVNSTR